MFAVVLAAAGAAVHSEQLNNMGSAEAVEALHPPLRPLPPLGIITTTTV